MADSEQSPEFEKEASFVSHLIELRDRLLRSVIAVFVVFLCLFPFANTIYTSLAGPLLAHLPDGTSMIAIEVASPFLTPFKLALVLSVFLAIPYLLAQIWAFVAPGLYTHEKRLARPLLVASTLLFYCGMAFAYYVVFPLVFAFMAKAAPDGVAMMTDISRYLDFVLTIFFAFGVAFQVPVATIVLVISGAVTTESLSQKRPYVIVGAFVIGMFLTPPDVISQTLLAFPMWVLFEVGILLSRVMVRRKEEGARVKEQMDAGDGTAAVATATSSVGQPPDSLQWRPLTEEEMDTELDQIEDEEDDDTPAGDGGDGSPDKDPKNP